MVGYLEQIIGTSYADNPELFIICCLVFTWFIYQFWTFVYYLFGVKK